MVSHWILDKWTDIKGYRYEIYSKESPSDLIVRSEECFDSSAKAEFAAIGHICLLEHGERE